MYNVQYTYMHIRVHLCKCVCIHTCKCVCMSMMYVIMITRRDINTRTHMCVICILPYSYIYMSYTPVA